MSKINLGIIGLGQMGSAIAGGLASSGLKNEFQIFGSTRGTDSAKEAAKDLGIRCGTDNSDVVKSADIIILAIKPHQVEKTLKSVASQLKPNQLLISICASITTEQLDEWSDHKPSIIRAMPNTPCLIRNGMTAICEGPRSKKQDIDIATKIFSSLGKVAVIEESLFDGVTGLSACGPAYIYLILESFSEAGVKIGISRETSILLAAQTMMGAAQMVLQGNKHPASLKDEVTTPAGCTIDGLMALEEGKLRVTLIKGVLAATRRSKALRLAKQ